MKLNKKLEIGIKAITALKKRNGFASASEILEESGTTINFLEQVMHNLKRGGLISVKRGPNGGYLLNNSESITAYSVAKAVGRFNDESSDYGNNTANVLQKNVMEAYKNTVL